MDKIALAPGIFSEASQLEAKGRWWSGNMVRFRQGMPEKFGGWVTYVTPDVIGVPRSMLSYFFLTGDPAVGIGTSDRLQMVKGGQVFDLTPIDRSVSVTNGFTTTISSSIVRITFAGGHGAKVGDYLLLPVFSLGGINFGPGTDPWGGYRVTTVVSPTVLEFEAGMVATSSVALGGGVRLVQFLYPVGSVGALAGLGWGAGAFSRAGWGMPAPISGIASALRYWSLAQWGERLLSVPNGGPLFAFAPSGSGAVNSRAARVVNSLDGTVEHVVVTNAGSGYVSPPTVTIAGPGGGGVTATATANIAAGMIASIVITGGGSGYSSAPVVSFSGGGGGVGAAATALLAPIRSPSLVNNFVMVGATERHAIILGSGDLALSTGYDPMLIRWSDVDDYSDWYPDGINSAGQRRAQEGSKLIAGCNLTLAALVWSDTALHQMRFVGAPFWYSVEVLGRNCGLVGPAAFVELGGAAFWMGLDAFWMWRGGAPIQLVCSEYSRVFDNLNRGQASRIACGTNVANNEVIWFYPTHASASGECDAFIAVNLSDMSWYGGALARTAWIDAGAVGKPLAASPAGRIYQHETGSDADGEAMGERLESGFIDIGSGDPWNFLPRLVPDWERLSGGVQMYVLTQTWPGRPVRVRGPYPVSATTPWVGVRSRGMALAIVIEGVGVGGDWRLGALRGESKPIGGR